jgi:hypothetical protein
MKLSSDILRQLESIARERKSLRMLNIYKGIPVAYDASILEIQENVVTFSVHRYQATCLELQRQAYLQTDDLEGMVRGSVLAVDILNETAALAAFVYVDESIGSRMAVRVYPKELTPVEIIFKDRKLKGQLSDISFSGVGLQTGAIFYGPGFFSPNSRVTLAFQLPAAKSALKLSGTIVNVTVNQNAYRLGIALSPGASAQAALMSYISQRQAEIQRELRMMYDIFYKLKSEEGKS